MLKRLNEEIRRRTQVVRIFPNGESCLRLVRALAVEARRWRFRPALRRPMYAASIGLARCGISVPVDGLEQPHAPLDRRPYRA
jgi:Transposase, Mutator family